GDRSRVVGLALGTAREAVADAGWSDEQITSAGLVVGTSKGAIVDWIDSDSCGAGVGDVAFELASELGMTGGPKLTVSAACASGLLALIRGALMIKSGEAKRVLVVAAEASVHELFIESFRRLGVLPAVGELCRPFDETRSGFLMSEAGAAICLENAGERSGGDLFIEKMAMGGDATHLISGDDRGATLRALLHDVIDGRPVDLIHAHGTGTVQNDAMELRAIEDSVSAAGGMRPTVYSHKGALGHSLGAAGLVSVAINRMIHQEGVVPPGLGGNLMSSKVVELSQHAVRRKVKRSVAIAAGFGGAMGVISLVTA
ncbi:MAG TPA: beta-ketoacyl synthase N-terminal-like domain-containing protein, partial [Tepidisphaeraceae bacterium]|nr:beta-ketoacyl synthase N-terminal-like domain-containing protein [Tepidisphaeraceae bacterium]